MLPGINETRNDQGWKYVAEKGRGTVTVNQPKYMVIPVTYTCGVRACTELVRTLSLDRKNHSTGRVKNEKLRGTQLTTN